MPNKQEIIQGLKQRLTFSHSPYSGVQVVAAVVYEVEGKECIAYGVNVENVSYGLTVCAERSAISMAVTNGMTSITALYVMSNQSDPISPCGACRQVVTEFMQDEQAPVLCVNEALNKEWKSTLGHLLPNRFDLS
ncbi:cytidine deaminase [Glaciecola sp.]|jgi:cytidine deaminase|uniref:cytidine deaminase n=1 Tax=Glaciecola sp. MF2-115 TaxID=3384827 RepID=UPI003988A359|mmetsp:Transcript_45164/g.143808  ORF Transcript_45164/g.143808 Transcript_45164/m.143808 type:complete len:135 (+) Transcript_45164:63-467(+)